METLELNGDELWYFNTYNRFIKGKKDSNEPLSFADFFYYFQIFDMCDDWDVTFDIIYDIDHAIMKHLRAKQKAREAQERRKAK